MWLCLKLLKGQSNKFQFVRNKICISTISDTVSVHASILV